MCGCFWYKIVKSFISFAVHINLKKITLSSYVCTLFTSIAIPLPFLQLSEVFYIMPKFPKISAGSQMGRSVSVPSDRNIRDPFGGGPL